MEIYEGMYTFNDHVNIHVNHLGEYNVQVNVYDKYNHIFTNKGLSSLSIAAKPILYSFYINQEKSNNNINFYRYNRNGELIDDEYKNLLLGSKEDL
jgi:hypothetical protein